MTGQREFDRVEAERRRRMQHCYDTDRPDKAEIRAAMQRWRSAQTQHTRTISLRASWVVAGVLLLSGGAMAATRVARLPTLASLLSWSTAKTNSVAAAKTGTTRYYVERAGQRVQYEQPAEINLAPGEHAVLTVKEMRTEFVGPGVARIQPTEARNGWVTQFEPRGWAPVVAPASAPSTRQAAAPVQPTTNNEQPAPGAPVESKGRVTPTPTHDSAADPRAINGATSLALPPNTIDGAWSRAASAMRRGDDVAARVALSEISRSSDPATRDAALLAQAQLDLAAGRNDRAMPLLNRLAQTGATAFVRERAREIVVNGR